ncbi:MAG: hypothetical protein Q4F29_01415 [Lachnospiraceae bacterium]|nr:hypothetical protein [Lachnospiraceae bacterium]
MKKKLGLIIGVLISCMTAQMTVLADSDVKEQPVANISSVKEESVLLPKGVKQSVDYDNETRGTYIAVSTLTLSNEGYGVLGAYASTAAHVPVKKIRMNIYLDQWDEAEQVWNQVSFKQIVYEDKEEAKDLNAVSESFNIEGCEPGYYYRLRATHAVWSFSGATEVHATRTEGVLLTSGPI